MSNETRNKIIRVMELALLINPTATRKELTGDKPTIFVHFFGNCNAVEIDINSDGWGLDGKSEETYQCFFSADKEAKGILDKALARLEEMATAIPPALDGGLRLPKA